MFSVTQQEGKQISHMVRQEGEQRQRGLWGVRIYERGWLNIGDTTEWRGVGVEAGLGNLLLS